MFKSVQQQFLLVALSAAASSSSSTAKREISDAYHSSGAYGDSFPLAVTDTLGSGALSPLAYAGSLGNLYARDAGLATGYEYPQYALGYGRYEPYTADVTPGVALPVSSEEVDDDVVWGSYYGRSLLPPGNLERAGIGGLAAGYPHGAPGLFPRPAFYLGRLGAGYYRY